MPGMLRQWKKRAWFFTGARTSPWLLNLGVLVCGGPIYGIISLNPDLKTVRRINILHQEETPGLGARIADNSYLSQFKNKEFFPSLVFTPRARPKPIMKWTG